MTLDKPQTWQVTCSVCGEERWPYQRERPDETYACMRCRSVPAEKREARVVAARKGRAARHSGGAQTGTTAS